ncbi:hypothetical protein MM300_17960 [Evansella sp. LMS18]|uniref:hypothetical protein n=1 Tax=Evansella sp. LMS18 TaxID=2924033 RepID=UPI0020D0AF4B|nr:hypothetical protein [Evansella sp. LMS18]UTR09753.1 hypothetical protein MM300_17960 [Evansella sp. LMS18]
MKKKLVVVLLVVVLYTGLALPSQVETVTGEHGFYLLEEDAALTCFLVLNTASGGPVFYEMTYASDTMFVLGKMNEFNFNNLVCEKIVIVSKSQYKSPAIPINNNFSWIPAPGEVGSILRNLFKGWIENGIWFQLLFF